MKISTKIILSTGLGALLSIAAVSALIGQTSNKVAASALTESVKNNLISIRNSKKNQVEEYFNTIFGQLKTFSSDLTVVEAMQEFSIAFEEFQQVPNLGSEEAQAVNSWESLQNYYDGAFLDRFQELNNGEEIDTEKLFDRIDDRSKTLQSLYISDNPNPLGEKEKLESANDGSRYSFTHAKYHTFFREFLFTFGYYDIFLVNNEGDVVYTVFKELDYSTNLVSGPYSNSGLGDAFRASIDETDKDTVRIVDFDEYVPSYNDAASFFSSPVFQNGRKIGVLVMQAPINRLNGVMTSNENWETVGLGVSGETYIVAEDNTLRNDSRFLIEDKINYLAALRIAGEPNTDKIAARLTSIGLQGANTPGTKDALSGNEGFDIFPDYRNVPVLSAYTPLNIAGLSWVLMAEIDEAEAFGPINDIKASIIRNGLIIGGITLLLVGLGALLLVRSITSPLNKLTGTIKKISDGDMSARAEITTNDEFSQLGNAFDSLLEERISTMQKAEKENEQLNDSVIDLMTAASRLATNDLTVNIPVAEDVTGPISDALNMVVEETSSALKKISNISQKVEESAKVIQNQGESVSIAASSERKVIGNTIEQLKEVSSAMEDMANLVNTSNVLASNVRNSTSLTAETVNKSVDGMNQIRETISETEKRIKRLGERSQEIGGIVSIINTISERTHVLALNASMQAAGAGEAGKGFAVVADEVQRLAESAKESTQEISALVENIQFETAEAISTMNLTIDRVVEGTQLAERAGSEMSKTQLETSELGQAFDKISVESESQTKANAKLMVQANEILEYTETTSHELAEQSVQTEHLVTYAGQLAESVKSFKLES